jgi:hypothetical protein
MPKFDSINNNNHLKTYNMKKTFTTLSLIIISSLAFAQAPLLIEDFNYAAGDALTAHGWIAHSSAATNPILVTSPGLTFAGYVGSNIGLAAGENGNGQDVNKLFSVPTSGAVYVSFLVNATASNPALSSAIDFFHFFDPAQTSARRGRTSIKSKTGKMLVGLSFNSNALQDSIPILLDFGTTYLFVAKYKIVEGVTNDVVSLYIFKAGDNFASEPATPTLGPLTATNTTPGDLTTPLGPDIIATGIALRQFDAAQKITVDGFRVKTSWELAVDIAPTMAVSTNTLSIASAASSTNTFNITSNAPWTVVSDQTWLTASIGSGYGNAAIILTAEENLTSAARTANVKVTTDGVTTQTIVVTQDASTTGINDKQKQQVGFYPNPVTDGCLNIKASVNSEKQVEIFDLVGKKVLNQNTSSNKIDVKNLKAGVYVLKVVTDNKTTTSKLIIK